MFVSTAYASGVSSLIKENADLAEEVARIYGLDNLPKKRVAAVQAHPFREAGYIDHIRLFPRSVHAVEVVNSNRPEPVNRMADIYAEHYDLLRICGSDNHRAGGLFADLEGKGLSPEIAGMCSEQPLNCTGDFIRMFLSGGMRMFAQSASGGFRLLD